ncbi:MAG: vWA domain-containing protein [Fervidobacterium sp.]
MKKYLKNLIVVFLVLTAILILYSCSNIPVAPKIIPPDPVGTVKPSTNGYSMQNIFLSIDKMPTLLPIAVPDNVNVRISLSGVENLSENDIRIFEDDKEQGFVLYKESETRSKIDIAIVLDVTGSMGYAISGAKNSIIEFADALINAGLDVQLGIVPYDDFVNPPKDIQVTPAFLNLKSPTDAKLYVELLYAGYGGDTPENLYDAIMFAATAMDWRPSAQRSMIVITDAQSHYKGDGTAFTHFTKSDMLPKLVGYFTIHGAFVPAYYRSTTTDFSAPEDPREICQKTGGIIKYTDSSGNVDLTNLGIVEYVTSSWIAAFESDSPIPKHKIEVFYTKGTDKRYSKLQDTAY